ncbi:MAG TPA: pseudouridine synthase [Rectinemataceae bacterium]|nr:pseudouridine synthase [Rectinemataceae bacterium]
MIPALYRDEDILVLDKPAGLASQPGAGVRLSLVEAVERDYGFRPFLVHRLDKETAGCIIVARSARAAARWTALVESRELRKVYRAVVSGLPSANRGVFDEALPLHGGRVSARTHWRLLGSFGSEGAAALGAASNATAPNAAAPARLVAGPSHNGVQPPPDGAPQPPDGRPRPAFSYLELELDTGRMHQIRLHLAGAGLPILGDDRHGDFAVNKRLRKEAGLKRLLLLAYSLRLPGGPLLRAAVPRHFLDFLALYPDAPDPELP